MSASPSPVPPAAASAEGESSSDWRASVQQSYRNTEVREIAKVLAALEPGASASSKLRLAMQFEDALFKSATSLADYRKRIAKRLKKVQKSYVPTNAQHRAKEDTESRLLGLRQQYGDALRYILTHASTAVEQMKVKHGEEKATQLQQHTNGVKAWAADLGILLEQGQQGKPNLSISAEQLEKLSSQLERRVENIRSHVVKLADPDLFLLETLERTEKEATLQGSNILAANTRQRYERQQNQTVDASNLFQQALEGVQLTVPLATRRELHDQQQKNAAIIHLQKMRAAGTLILAWMMVPDKSSLSRKNDAIQKAYTEAQKGSEFAFKVMKEQRKGSQEPGVTLEDAWMKTLELPSATVDDSSEQASTTTTTPSEKRHKTTSKSPTVSSRVLLTPGRKVPSNLLPALKRKRATLVRPPPHGEGSHLVLEFEAAFVMKIYFVPLLVTLRAAVNKSKEKIASDDLEKDVTGSVGSSALFTPLCEGLTAEEEDGDDGNDPELNVWGATGTYCTLGRVVEERLRDASTHATYVLRKCFENASSKQAEFANVFEVEIREATALLEFIQLARTTYIPDWQDDDD